MIDPKQIVDLVHARISTSAFKAVSFQEFQALIDMFIGAIMHFKDEIQIANVYKSKLKESLKLLLFYLHDSCMYEEQLLLPLVKSIFDMKDRRWILLLFAEFTPLIQPYITEQLIVQAQQHNFARDHIYLLKSMVA